VIGLDAPRTAHALSLAAQTAGGFTQAYAHGTGEWVWQVAQAARAGVEAELLAERGLVASPATLKGPHGFYRAVAGRQPAQRTGWSAQALMLKPFPGCAINQSSVALMIDLVKQHKLHPDDVRSVTAQLNPLHGSTQGSRRTAHSPRSQAPS